MKSFNEVQKYQFDFLKWIRKQKSKWNENVVGC